MAERLNTIEKQGDTPYSFWRKEKHRTATQSTPLGDIIHKSGREFCRVGDTTRPILVNCSDCRVMTCRGGISGAQNPAGRLQRWPPVVSSRPCRSADIPVCGVGARQCGHTGIDHVPVVGRIVPLLQPLPAAPSRAILASQCAIEATYWRRREWPPGTTGRTSLPTAPLFHSPLLARSARIGPFFCPKEGTGD